MPWNDGSADHLVEYTGWPEKSKPLSRTIIKSYYNPLLRLDFSSILTTK